MRTPKWLTILFAAALLAGLLPLTAAATPVALDADLQRTLEAEGQANFFVVMSAQADLSAAYGMDWAARGEYVWNALNEIARATQAPVIDYAKRNGLDYTSFLTGNSVYIRGGSLAAAQDLAGLPGVAYLRLEQFYQVDPILDGPAAAEATTDWGITDTKANQVWSTLGVRGAGIKVANIDTGVQWNHPALVNQFACPGAPTDAKCWKDPANICGAGGACDNNGHGTHTMGTMVAKDDPNLTYIAGMSPDSTWIACKGCESSSCSDSSLNACADWILAPGGDTNNRPHVVNNSWGGGGGDNWYLGKVQAWRAAGIFPAFSAGNSGSSCNTLGSPGDYQESFGSAAHQQSGRLIASYSSRGPSAFGSTPYTKPNISAPGSSVCSTVPTNAWSCTYSGTSMASPHTAGAVALVWSGCPAYKGNIDATFQILQNTADTPPAGNCGAGPNGGNYTYGYGYLNALAAVQSCIGGTGTLQGTVTDATTNLPIAGATVTAAPAAEGNGIQAVTDPNGFYSMILMPGTYNVTASKADYYSQTVGGVVIVADQTTTQNFALQPLPPPVYLFCDDMESGPGNWTHNAAQGVDDWAIVTTSYNSPTHAWYTADVSTVSDKRLWNTVAVAIPTNVDTAGLKFWHRYAFESGYDGSVIEISTNNGVTWNDLGAYITQNGYNATLSSNYSNPLGGRQAWSGTAAWNEVKVDLTAFKGQSVQVRFRIGTDSSVAGTGWWIDDVCYYTVGSPCEPVSNAAFSWQPASPFVGEQVAFSGSASGTAPISYAWTFGDGGTGSGAAPTYTYTSAGTFTVTMTASNACGSQEVQHDITVQPVAGNTVHLLKWKMNQRPAAQLGWYKVIALGFVHDQDHLALAGITVSGNWTYPDTTVHPGSSVTPTNALGQWKIRIKEQQCGLYAFDITGMSGAGYTYNPADNHMTTHLEIQVPCK